MATERPPRHPWRSLLRPSAALAVLALALVAGGALRAHQAANPSTHYSNDEVAYVKVATSVAFLRHYDFLSRSKGEAFRRPPGAPVAFAVAHRVSGDFGPRPIYWAQWVFGISLIACVFLLAGRLAGQWAGAATAVLVAAYPPLVRTTGEALSEPLGALTFAVWALSVLWAWEHRRSWWAWIAPGLALAAVVLTRTDHLTLPFFAMLLAGAFVWWREGFRLGLQATAVGGLVCLAALLPWVVYASRSADTFVPVTMGSGSALFVGTYLPGGGTTFGMKREMQEEVRSTFPEYRDHHWSQLPAGAALNVVALRHPELSREDAIQREGRRNLSRYALRQPVEFTGMGLQKAARMWGQPFSGGGYTNTDLDIAWHRLLLFAALAGLVAGIVLTRHPVLASIMLACLLGTGVHAIVVSQPRYALPLMPILIAGGVAGLFMAREARSGPARPAPRSAS